jgi:hypothetical protein
MRKSIILIISLAIIVLVVGTCEQIGPIWASSGKNPPGGKHARPLAAPVVNEILDLLDEDLFLAEEANQDVWRSEVFDTSQFTRIGLRAYGEAQGLITCSVAWRFTDGDEFRESIPWVWIGNPFYQGPDPQVRFSEVRGLAARVICELDRSSLDPGSSLPASGTLTDVKVMLRR